MSASSEPSRPASRLSELAMATVLGLTVGVGSYAGMSMITPLAWLRVLVAVVAGVFFAILWPEVPMLDRRPPVPTLSSGRKTRGQMAPSKTVR